MQVMEPQHAASALPSHAPANVAPRQLLRLALGEHRYGVTIDRVREILKSSQLTALPLMPAFVLGVMNLRGAVVPVIDLGARLGLSSATLTRRSCVVIVELPGNDSRSAQTFGLMVDAVHEVADIPPSGLESVPSLGTDIRGDYLEGMARLRGEIVPVLALERVLDEDALTLEIASHVRQGAA